MDKDSPGLNGVWTLYLDLSLPIWPFIFCYKPIPAPENAFYPILTPISTHSYYYSILSFP